MCLSEGHPAVEVENLDHTHRAVEMKKDGERVDDVRDVKPHPFGVEILDQPDDLHGLLHLERVHRPEADVEHKQEGDDFADVRR